MRSLKFMFVSIAIVGFSTALFFAQGDGRPPAKLHPKEKHLRNIKQLTFGGENAEAYFSFDGKQVIFQSTQAPYKCDQIFTMNADGTNRKLVSTGKGRTTCAYFTPDGKRVIYASTHQIGRAHV